MRPVIRNRSSGIVPASRELSLDDAPRTLSTKEKLFWLNAYETGDKAYGAYGEKQVRASADKLIWDERHRTPTWNRKADLPDQGHTTWLGTLLEVHYFNPADGRVVVQRFRPAPDLMWSSSQKEDRAGGSLFAYPGMKMKLKNEQSAYTAPKAAKIRSRWTAGNIEPKGATAVEFPIYKMNKALPVAAVVYRSDKFSPTKKIDYIHHVENGVRVRFAPRNKAVYITGGKLKLTERGLEH